MAGSLAVRVVADGTETSESVLDALATVYERVDPADGDTGDDSTVDCVVAVAPLADAAWQRLADRGDAPLVVLASPADSESRHRATEAGATDVVIADHDRFAALAHRVRGVVEGRRSATGQGPRALESEAEERAADGRYLRDLYDVATDDALSFEAKTERILEIGLDRLGVENAHLSSIDRRPERYEVVASVGDLPIEPGVQLDLATTFCKRTIQSDDVLAIDHAAERGWRGDPAYEENDVECYLGARVTVGGSLYGTVCFMDRSPRPPFTEAERAFVSLVARWLSHELERRRRETAVDALHDGTARLLRAKTTGSVCETATEVAAAVLDAPRTRVWLVDDDPGTRLRAAADHACEADADPIERGDGRGDALWEALDDGATRRSDDPEGVDGTGFAERTRSALVTPLGTDGVLIAGSPTADAFDDVDDVMAGMVGSNVVAALERIDWIDQVRDARERFQRIFESASDGLLLVDPAADEIADCNDRLCELLGFDRAELRTVAPSTICRDDIEAFRRLLVRAREEGRAGADELVCRDRGGGRIPVAVSAAAVELDGRDYVLASVRDIRDRLHREQALSVFNRVLRHNIRNDMNVVIGRATMLRGALDGADQRAHLDHIVETARKLTELGEKARTFRRLDDREPEADSVAVGGLLERVRESLVGEYPDATVTIRGADDATAAVAPTIDVAMRELLENAIKHATTDDPAVTVTVARDEDGVSVRVADEGPGLPEQDRAVLEGGYETPLNHGSGLGLWLANWVVTAAGGSIAVVDAGPEGTTIELSLPAATGAAEP
ncbi:ATP-binding protein [Halorientalis halophila]|uniref:ATP-binding protein n=1 Tax=Halorientalis halophila TaxID=3108499 RepID=UPI00300A93B5